jgi:NAD(P)-dependent dehydrogenase (short-subunit alcohol dehydrogenase family)
VLDFTGKTALITGAAGALGSATAKAFADAGARLVVVDLAEDRLNELYGGRDGVLIAAADLTRAESVKAMVDKAIAHYGRIDVVANVAGGFAMGPEVHETPEKDWDFMLNLNARSVFLMAQALIPHMRAQGGGKMVNVAARAALAGKGKMAPYIVSKAAVVRLTESLAAENRAHGINVNCILPGTIDTPANREAMSGADFSKWVPTEDLANVMLFLCSDAARSVHGAAVPVYGLS